MVCDSAAPRAVGLADSMEWKLAALTAESLVVCWVDGLGVSWADRLAALMVEHWAATKVGASAGTLEMNSVAWKVGVKAVSRDGSMVVAMAALKDMNLADPMDDHLVAC